MNDFNAKTFTFIADFHPSAAFFNTNSVVLKFLNYYLKLHTQTILAIFQDFFDYRGFLMYTNDSKTQCYRKTYNLKDMGLVPVFLSSETSILMHRLDSDHTSIYL